MRWRGYKGLYLPLPLLTKEGNRNAGFPIGVGNDRKGRRDDRKNVLVPSG